MDSRRSPLDSFKPRTQKLTALTNSSPCLLRLSQMFFIANVSVLTMTRSKFCIEDYVCYAHHLSFTQTVHSGTVGAPCFLLEIENVCYFGSEPAVEAQTGSNRYMYTACDRMRVWLLLTCSVCNTPCDISKQLASVSKEEDMSSKMSADWWAIASSIGKYKVQLSHIWTESHVVTTNILCNRGTTLQEKKFSYLHLWQNISARGSTPG